MCVHDMRNPTTAIKQGLEKAGAHLNDVTFLLKDIVENKPDVLESVYFARRFLSGPVEVEDSIAYLQLLDNFKAKNDELMAIIRPNRDFQEQPN